MPAPQPYRQNPLLRQRQCMDVVFEEVLQAAPELAVESDVPMLTGGWFRGIVLRKR